jgi:hypothetical protein
MDDVSAQRLRVRARRLHLWRLMHLGYTLRESVQQIAADYACSERTVYYDWEQRHYWLCKEALFQNLEPFYIELLATLQERRRQTQALLRKSHASKNPAVQLGCLKLLHQMDQDLLKHGKTIINFLVHHASNTPYTEKALKTKYWNYHDAEAWEAHTETNTRRRRR